MCVLECTSNYMNENLDWINEQQTSTYMELWPGFVYVLIRLLLCMFTRLLLLISISALNGSQKEIWIHFMGCWCFPYGDHDLQVHLTSQRKSKNRHTGTHVGCRLKPQQRTKVCWERGGRRCHRRKVERHEWGRNDQRFLLTCSKSRIHPTVVATVSVKLLGCRRPHSEGGWGQGGGRWLQGKRSIFYFLFIIYFLQQTLCLWQKRWTRGFRILPAGRAEVRIPLKTPETIPLRITKLSPSFFFYQILKNSCAQYFQINDYNRMRRALAGTRFHPSSAVQLDALEIWFVHAPAGNRWWWWWRQGESRGSEEHQLLHAEWFFGRRWDEVAHGARSI